MISGDLKWEDLVMHRRLADSKRPIDRVFFLDTGLASNVTNTRHQKPIEIGVVGREGVVNLPVLLGTDRTPGATYIQIPGDGHSIETCRIREAMAESTSLQRAVVMCAYVYMEQMASTVLANGRGTVLERLARWLLMAHDRVDGDALPLTHELLSVMLGARRSGVTVALRTFEERGLVDATRGLITILDRDGLEETANGFYGIAEAEMRRLFGSKTLQ
jgi:CRP-like cAMP-binding protein